MSRDPLTRASELTPKKSRTPKRPRARDLGIRIGVYPTGRHNAITDVPGVRVGHCTRIEGEGPLVPGEGPIRTGVTAIFPARGNIFNQRVVGSGFVLNGAGEVAGLTQVTEWGLIETPIVLTNTLAVGTASDAVVRWMVERNPGIGDQHDVVIPVVGECDDSWLNDATGRHIRAEQVWQALDSAKGGAVEEGSVGGGTGMVTCDFNAGIGSSSRKLPVHEGGFTLGVLVMSNFGRRRRLTVAGRLIGPEFPDLMPELGSAPKPDGRHAEGSCIVIAATDAPLTSHQLARVAKRAAWGLIRTGSAGGNGSGEIALAFSTAYTLEASPRYTVELLNTFATDDLFEATVDAAEEAVINSLCMATTTVGRDGNTAYAIPLDRLAELVG